LQKITRSSENSLGVAPVLFNVAGHFHMRKFIAGHKRFCDVTNPLLLLSVMR